jgi:hypothetical protein
MTIVDPTRLNSGSAPPGGGPEVPDGGDQPSDCHRCAAAGGVCDFHLGWAAGWDVCAAVVASSGDRSGDGSAR